MKITFNGLRIDVEEGDKLNHEEPEGRETLTQDRGGQCIGYWTWTMDTGWIKGGPGVLGTDRESGKCTPEVEGIGGETRKGKS